MTLIIDNYDSFTYNLYQILSEISEEPVRVERNDRITLREIELMAPSRIVISPGPGTPEDAGISVEAVRKFSGKLPILGVCLGHQAIGYAFGGRIKRAARIVHGKVEDISLDGKGLFRNLPSPSAFTRYHSLVIDPESLPEELEVTAFSRDGEIMGVRHKRHTVEGIQFHPESVASPHGRRLLKNFLTYRREPFVGSATLGKLMAGKDLEHAEAEGFMEELTEGNLDKSQIAAFLVCFTMKGVTPEELAALASVLRRKKKSVPCSRLVLDTCGTGGDGLGTFNISSLAAIVASACGAWVAKHGNRGVSSPTGSADFYRSLGIPVELSPDKAAQLLKRTGFTFLFAPLYHGAMRHAAETRKELRVKTVMNLLGPLTNPADAAYQLIGVFDERYCEPMARAARILGASRVMVVHGGDGMDEISVTGPTRIVMIDETGTLSDRPFHAAELGVPLYRVEDLKGGTADENAAIAREIISGGGREAIKEAVLLNAGAALHVCGLAGGIPEGYRLARQSLSSGKVKEKLRQILEDGEALAAAPTDGPAASNAEGPARSPAGRTAAVAS
jgi:anthranilate synthase/phosphoribosyltransferase